MSERPTIWAILRPDAPFAHLFPGRRVPLRQPAAIRPRDATAPPCYLVAGDALTDDQVAGLAADLFAMWAPECTSLDEAAAYIRQDLPIKVSWFEALDLGLGPISLRGTLRGRARRHTQPDGGVVSTINTPNEHRFDLVAFQRLNGAIVGLLRPDVPAGEAMRTLAVGDGEDYGYGVVAALVSTTDPLYQLRNELERARGKHAPLNSAHEAYAVILEELDEFKAEVWKKRSERDPARMREELIQVAAMAIRAIEDLGL